MAVDVYGGKGISLIAFCRENRATVYTNQQVISPRSLQSSRAYEAKHEINKIFPTQPCRNLDVSIKLKHILTSDETYIVRMNVRVLIEQGLLRSKIYSITEFCENG
jgi:hypothetical protein